MKITTKDRSAKLAKTPLLVLLCCEGETLSLPPGVTLPATALADFKGKAREARLVDPTGGDAERVLLVGLGKRDAANWEAQRRAGAIASKRAESLGLKSYTLWTSDADDSVGCGAEGTGRSLAEGAVMGTYKYTEMKSKAEKPSLAGATLIGKGTEFKRGVERGAALADANLFTRDLQNAPGNALTPTKLAAAARKLAGSSPRLTIKVIEEAEMKKLGMGALLGVSNGSREPAKLIHLVYKPTKRARGSRKVALVGKGLTFDAGGISIKPAAKMEDMKYDMSGGAAVLGTFHALAALGCPHEVHGIVPASENLPDGQATKPGDVHTAMNGTTIEVINTDAEGRLILADALCYTTTKVKPDEIIDLATLTGAVIIALGHELTGMFPSTPELRDRLRAAGDATGEPVWELPLLECHKEQMKGTVADLRNINTPGQGNGSTSGAAFLSNFVGETPWCHLDIAGTAWGSLDRDYTGGPMGSGVGPRLLMEYLTES
ncbi:leucyl aminopeptidase family protein [Engelhardtia mirabilis]|uniref:Probable cytosol aminopeptidase n=1 Tax=Engelhardtia mirabilis TaxID=2528011 RepID=A0A518BLU5_9BACT|nr:Cytosol aminopeptidase [Planctomycetes bacterium Pla133]QDV02269.1 Cytosol aminopeptidase [Planctomycetes bacterium Pla86]